MKVIDLPFSQKLGIVISNNEAYLLQMPFTEQVMNHLNTFHGSASSALAEITSGYFLKINFPHIATICTPMLRSSRVKYRTSATADLYSTAELKGLTNEELSHELMSRRKSLFTIQVKLYTADGVCAVEADFDWFVMLH